MFKKFWEAEFVQNVKKDFTTKEYIPLKILHFLLHGGMMTLFPFLTIQARSIGITEDEIGIIYSLLPLVGIFAPAFAGMLGDKIGNFRILMSVMVALSGTAALLFLAVPPGRIEVELPAKLPMNLTCSDSGALLRVMEPYACELTNATSGSLQMSKCSLKCDHQVLGPVPSVAPLNSSGAWCSLTDGCHYVQPFEEERFVTEVEEFGSAVGNASLELSFKILGDEDPKIFQLDESFCPNMQKLTGQESRYDVDSGIDHRKNCRLECDATTARNTVCSNKKYVQIFSPYTTSIAYGAVHLLNGFTLATSFPLFEGAVVAVVKETNGDFGLQRIFANIGMVVLTPISGALIDLFSTETTQNFRPAFYLYFGLKLLAAFIILFINLDFKQPSKKVVKGFKDLISMPEVALFIFVTCISGVCFGFLDTFLFWLLQDIGAEKSLMGMTVTVGASVGIPLLIFATPLIKRFGHVNILSFSLATFAVRMFGYSMIYNPWLAMPFEMLECITISLARVVSLSYSARLSTQSTVASLQGIYSGTFYGVGRGLGSLLGGFLIKSIGIRLTFQILSASCAFGSITYIFFNNTKIKTWKVERHRKYHRESRANVESNKPEETRC